MDLSRSVIGRFVPVPVPVPVTCFRVFIPKKLSFNQEQSTLLYVQGLQHSICCSVVPDAIPLDIRSMNLQNWLKILRVLT